MNIYKHMEKNKIYYEDVNYTATINGRVVASIPVVIIPVYNYGIQENDDTKTKKLFKYIDRYCKELKVINRGSYGIESYAVVNRSQYEDFIEIKKQSTDITNYFWELFNKYGKQTAENFINFIDSIENTFYIPMF